MAPKIMDPMPLPEKLRRDRAQVFTTMEQLRNEYGREPSDEEVMDITGIPLKRMLKVKQAMHAKIPLSVYEAGSEDESGTPDITSSSRSPMDDWLDAVYHDSNDIDKVILQYKSGYRGAPILSNQEIAAKLKLSPGAVSQRSAKLQARLGEFNG